ncbi:MAG: type II toxin-antitoxin system Phd/YefM family antitoxin [Acidimicrobiales bacterium]
MFVNTHDAKTHLSRLIDRAVAGEEIVIGRAGRPLVRMVPYVERSEPRLPGSMAGRIAVAPDFDETPEWLLDSFEGARGGA